MSAALGTTVPFITFFPAIMAASWYGGFGPGALITALSAITAQYFLMEPYHSFKIASTSDLFAQITFIGIGIFISALNEARERALRRASEASALAEERLKQLRAETEAREKAQALEAQARRWATDTLSSIGDAVICTDVDGRVTYMNSIAQELTAWSIEEAKGRPLKDIFIIVNETTRKPAPNPIMRVLQEGRILGLANHTVLIAKNGAEIPIDDSGAPIRDQNRQIVGAVLVFRNIADRKALEDNLRALTTRLANSNTDLADYAHAISHDLQEPLRTMSTFAQLLRRKYEGLLDAEANRCIEFIVNGSNRMSRMIRDLLAFSRVVNNTTEMTTLRLSDAVNWAEQNLEELIRETSASIHCEDLPTVFGDHIQLVQLFQNLIANALKYRSEEPPVLNISGIDMNTHWQVTVRDNGRGVSSSDHQYIFKLFKRLESGVPGSGIGLAVCKRIAQRHGGDIWVESEPGKGSAFHFTLAKANPEESRRLAIPAEGHLRMDDD